MNRKPSKHAVDPLDAMAQNALGTRPEEVRLDAPVPAVVVESQVMWLVVASVAGGPWTRQLVAENLRSASFSSRRRAEGVMSWLKMMSEQDGTQVEYRLLPILRAEQAI